MDKLLTKLKKIYPDINYLPGPSFSYSPKDNVVYYPTNTTNDISFSYSLLHETAHSLLKHQLFDSDFDLLRLEAEAWNHAEKIGTDIGLPIDKEHAEDCLDSYRDWLFTRSNCPHCNSTGLMTKPQAYQCLSCQARWRVSRSRFCRVYRLKLVATN